MTTARPVSLSMLVKGADWKNYKRSFVQRFSLRTLMQDAHGGLVR